MKIKNYSLIILTFIVVTLSSCSQAHAGWFSKDTTKEELAENKEKLSAVESQLDTQRKNTGDWQTVAFGLAIACVLLFTIGTAIGSKIRRHSYGTPASA